MDSGVEQRLLAGAVAREEQRLGAVVPDREGEHPVELLDRFDAVLEVEREDALDVRMRAERVVLVTRADLGRVVDLAVALEPHLAARRGERLVGALVEIDDAQPLGADDGVRLPEVSVPVGPAVAQRLAHEVEHFRTLERTAPGDHSAAR